MQPCLTLVLKKEEDSHPSLSFDAASGIQIDSFEYVNEMFWDTIDFYYFPQGFMMD